jgi:hypothetical protein
MMAMGPQIVSSVLGILVASIIFYLVRRDHMAPRQAIRWFALAIMIVVFGLFPQLIDFIGVNLDIAYPPIVAILAGMGVLVIKILILDIQQTKLKLTNDRLVQKIAMLEANIEEMKNNKS